MSSSTSTRATLQLDFVSQCLGTTSSFWYGCIVSAFCWIFGEVMELKLQVSAPNFAAILVDLVSFLARVSGATFGARLDLVHGIQEKQHCMTAFLRCVQCSFFDLLDQCLGLGWAAWHYSQDGLGTFSGVGYSSGSAQGTLCRRYVLQFSSGMMLQLLAWRFHCYYLQVGSLLHLLLKKSRSR